MGFRICPHASDSAIYQKNLFLKDHCPKLKLITYLIMQEEILASIRKIKPNELRISTFRAFRVVLASEEASQLKHVLHACSLTE